MSHIFDYYSCRSELNLGVDQTGFTLVKYFKPQEGPDVFVRVSFHMNFTKYLLDILLYVIIKLNSYRKA